MLEWRESGGIRWPRIPCPSGKHLMPELQVPITDDGYIPCRHTNGDTQVECGRKLWALLLPRRSAGCAPLLYVAELDWREITYMEQQHMDVPDVLAHVGALYAPVSAAPPLRRRP